jgi:hypothetical protein
MSFRSIVTVAAIGLLLAFGQLVASFAGARITIVCAAAVGLTSFGLLKLLSIEAEPIWVPIALSAAASAVGLLIRYLAGLETPTWSSFLAPTSASVAAAAITLGPRVRATRCSLCSHRMGSGGSFECPRCRLRVCERTCWVFEHISCRRCEENKVPIFIPDDKWWETQFGPQVGYGKCQLCLADADHADLRECGRCGRPQCRLCWDYANGQCSRCSWLVRDLPPQLRSYMLQGHTGNEIAVKIGTDRRSLSVR